MLELVAVLLGHALAQRPLEGVNLQFAPGNPSAINTFFAKLRLLILQRIELLEVAVCP